MQIHFKELKFRIPKSLKLNNKLIRLTVSILVFNIKLYFILHLQEIACSHNRNK